MKSYLYLQDKIINVGTVSKVTCLWIERLVPDVVSVVGPTVVWLLDFFCSSIQLYYTLSHCICLVSFLYLDLYLPGDDTSIRDF